VALSIAILAQLTLLQRGNSSAEELPVIRKNVSKSRSMLWRRIDSRKWDLPQ
jgi:hypothetical protein